MSCLVFPISRRCWSRFRRGAERRRAAGMRKHAFPSQSRVPEANCGSGESRLGSITAAAAALYSLFPWDNCAAARAPYFTLGGDERRRSCYPLPVSLSVFLFPVSLAALLPPSHLHSTQQVIAATRPTMEPSFPRGGRLTRTFTT